MAKLESSFRNMVLSLVMITGLAAALLASVYKMTKEPIAFSEKQKQIDAIGQVVPAFDNSPLDEAYKVAVAGADSFKVFLAKKNGKLVGAAVEAVTNKGFSGKIRLMVGFDAEGNVVNYVVLKHSETPGLGSKMQQWFSDKSKPSQSILGRNPETPLKVKKDGGEVDAITAATISSRAFLDAVNQAAKAYHSTTGNDVKSGMNAN